MISTRPFRFAMITGMSPQNSQISWRQAPQGGVRASVSVTTDENGDALGANGEAVGCVLDVAAAKDSSRSGTKRRANAKVGVRRMRVFPCLPRGRNQSFIFAHANVPWHAPKYSTQWPLQFAE